MKRYQFVVTVARRATLTVLLPAALLALGGCSKELKWENVKNTIQEGVKSKLDLALSGVTCPSEVRKAKEGDTFECTGTPQVGGLITFKVTQKDDEGKIGWEVTKVSGLFEMQPAEAFVKQELELQGEIITGVSCGSRWQAGKAGSRYDCRTEFGDGQTATLVVTAKDDAGKSWAME